MCVCKGICFCIEKLRSVDESWGKKWMNELKDNRVTLVTMKLEVAIIVKINGK